MEVNPTDSKPLTREQMEAGLKRLREGSEDRRPFYLVHPRDYDRIKAILGGKFYGRGRWKK